jgi:hypothetical protein
MTCDRTRTDFVRIVVIALILMFIGFGSTAAPPTHAASDQATCEVPGSNCVYTKDQGVSQCTCPQNPPPPHAEASKTEEESQKGSFKSSQPRDTSSCVNNPGGSHCK